MEIRKYNLFSIPFFAFFSKQAYGDVGRKWHGANLAYLFILLAFCCLLPTLSIQKHMAASVKANQIHIANQLPDIRISNGQVMVDQLQPHYITRKDGSTAIIINTTGSMNYIDDPRVVALLTETSLILRRGKNNFSTIDLAGINAFHIDRFIAGSWLNTIHGALAPLTYSALLLLSFGAALPIVLAMSLIGFALSRMLKSKLRFAGAFRIASMAATPSIIVLALTSALGIGVLGSILAVATLGYLVLGVIANAYSPDDIDEEHLDLKSLLHEGPSESQAA